LGLYARPSKGEQMISIAKKMLINMALPVFIEIVEDLIKSGEVTGVLSGVKTKAVACIMAITGETHFSLDDMLAEKIISYLETSDASSTVASELMDCVNLWVVSSETDWDDKIVLPIMAAFRESLGIKSTTTEEVSK
jgi:hypothetical protein